MQWNTFFWLDRRWRERAIRLQQGPCLTVPTALADWGRAAVDFVFPPWCVVCEEAFCAEHDDQILICTTCFAQLTYDCQTTRCRACGIPRRTPWPGSTRPCAECQRRRFRFRQVVAVGSYGGALRKAVLRMKQFHEFPLAASMGRVLAQQVLLQLGEELPDVVVPIPKHWFKRISRGSNAAEVLAEAAAATLRRPLTVGALRSQRKTRKQSLLGRSERQRNLAGSLALAKGYDFRKAHVLVVDDIMTTGATANEAARVLRRAGARTVDVAVVARASQAGSWEGT